MARGPKSAKSQVEARLPVTRKSPKGDGARVRDLENRLAEALRDKVEAQEQLQIRDRELAETREREIATGATLRVISSAPDDLEQVFHTLLANAARLCEAQLALLFRYEAGLFQLIGHHGDTRSADFAATAFPRDPFTASPSIGLGRIAHELRPVQIADLTQDSAYTEREPLRVVTVEIGGCRTWLGVPMLKDGRLVGAFVLWRREVQPFTDRQIGLVSTFADQAAIAIENVRLFNETKEALDRQTATSEILRVISSSPTDTQPVFDAIARNAVALCGGIAGLVLRYDGEMLHVAGHHEMSPAAVEQVERAYPRPPGRDYPPGRALLERRVVHIPDLQAATEFTASTARDRGVGSMLVVPLLGEGEAVGVISLARDGVGPFSAQQIEVLQIFTDQAVIAIENVRLFTELQEKNEALTQAHAQVTESLDQQTAMADILRVISASPTDVQPVFNAIAESAARLCSANDAQVLRVEGDTLRLVAACGTTSMPPVRQLTRGHLVGRAVIDRKTIHVRDLAQALAEYPETTAARYGVQSALAVPLLQDGAALGVIRISRTEISPFTEKQITLLKTFADQAVIAIENVRLFRELQARTRDLTRSVGELRALGEVGQAISSTLDLETVLTTIVSRAVQLSGLDGGVVFEYDEAAEEFVQRVATEGGGTLAEARRTNRVRKGEGVVGRTAITLEPVQMPDIMVAGAYASRLRENLIESGIRALLAVPIVRDDRLIGCLVVSRNHAGEFPSETIELLQTFATQSALAIQNARLFREIEEKSRQLEIASQHKSEFLANMSHELRTPLNAIIGFSEVLSEKMFGELNEKQEEYSRDIHASGQHLLSLINDILDLSKIEAGRMELELSDFHLPTALDSALTLVRERAGRRSITLQMTVDSRLGQIQADERKVRQVVLNLLSNAIKFTPEGGRIEVAAVAKDGLVEVSVSDTGVGIAPEDQEAVFEEFRQVGTADKKVEGTGLGLTLCRKFVELHGGQIWVKSELGEGSTFTFTLAVIRGE